MKPKIVFFGTPSFVIPVLKRLLENFDVVAVVTTPDTIQGRKKILTPSPIQQFCLDNVPSLKVLAPELLNEQILQQLTNLAPDLLVVAAYGKIIPQSILSIPKNGALNIHPSLLPIYRGPSPIQTALLNGDKTTGVTIIKMDEKMDHGDIVAQWEKVITPQDTFVSLHTTLFEEAAEKLPQIINDYIQGKITPTPQNEDLVTFCKMISKDSGYFDSINPPSATELDRMIRAYFPWPTAWTKIILRTDEEKIMKLLPEKMIQLEGGKPTPVKDIINGYPELRPLLEKLLETQN